MTALRIMLAAMGIGLAIYSGLVIAEHGWNFLPFYIADLRSVGWPGQFDLDFSILIALIAMWIIWREQFSIRGVVLAALLVPFVSMLLTGYLIYLSWATRGDPVRMLVGDRVARN